jgi:hypothetical protein
LGSFKNQEKTQKSGGRKKKKPKSHMKITQVGMIIISSLHPKQKKHEVKKWQ